MYPRRRTQRKSEVPRRALVNRSNFQYVVNTEKLQKLADESGLIPTSTLAVSNTAPTEYVTQDVWQEIYATDIVKVTSTSVSVLQSLQIVMFEGSEGVLLQKWNGYSWDTVYSDTISSKYLLDICKYNDNTVKFYVNQQSGVTYQVNSFLWSSGHALIRYMMPHNEVVAYQYIETELQTN